MPNGETQNRDGCSKFQVGLQLCVVLLLAAVVVAQVLILKAMDRIRYSIPDRPSSSDVYSVRVVNGDRSAIPITGEVEIKTHSFLNGQAIDLPVRVSIADRTPVPVKVMNSIIDPVPVRGSH